MMSFFSEMKKSVIFVYTELFKNFLTYLSIFKYFFLFYAIFFLIKLYGVNIYDIIFRNHFSDELPFLSDLIFFIFFVPFFWCVILSEMSFFRHSLKLKFSKKYIKLNETLWFKIRKFFWPKSFTLYNHSLGVLFFGFGVFLILKTFLGIFIELDKTIILIIDFFTTLLFVKFFFNFVLTYRFGDSYGFELFTKFKISLNTFLLVILSYIIASIPFYLILFSRSLIYDLSWRVEFSDILPILLILEFSPLILSPIDFSFTQILHYIFSVFSLFIITIFYLLFTKYYFLNLKEKFFNFEASELILDNLESFSEENKKSFKSLGLNLLKNSAYQNYSPAYNDLGYNYLNGTHVKENEKKALEYFKKSSDLGNDHGHFMTGLSYYHGWGSNIDYNQSLNFFSRIKSQYRKNRVNYYKATSHHRLGNYSEAFLEYEKVIKNEKNFKDLNETEKDQLKFSFYNMAKLLKYGVGIELNKTKSHEMFLKAYEHGLKKASFFIGENYETGFGTSKSLKKATHWYTIASINGEDKETKVNAQNKLQIKLKT